MADDVQMTDAPGGGEAKEEAAPPQEDVAEEMVLPMVDDQLLADVQAMGFDELRARKALMSGCSNANSALDWILEHENDAGIDEPIALVPKPKSLGSGSGSGESAMVAKSIKCVATGRLFRTTMEAQAYAEKLHRTNSFTHSSRAERNNAGHGERSRSQFLLRKHSALVGTIASEHVLENACYSDC